MNKNYHINFHSKDSILFFGFTKINIYIYNWPYLLSFLNSIRLYLATNLDNFSAAFNTFGTFTAPCQLLYIWHKSKVNLGIISSKFKLPYAT